MGSISVPTAMLAGGAMSGIGGIASGIMGSSASSAAAKAEAQALQSAVGLEQQNLQQTTTNLQPYMTAGTNALTKIQQLLGIGTSTGTPNYSAFTSSPGYQFLLNQGDQGINAKAMAGGMTGNAMKSLSQYNQGLAGTTFQTFLSNLGGLASAGQNAAQAIGSIGANVTGNMGSQTAQAGAVTGSGIMGSTNALTGAINSGLGSISGTMGGLAGYNQIAQLLQAMKASGGNAY